MAQEEKPREFRPRMGKRPREAEEHPHRLLRRALAARLLLGARASGAPRRAPSRQRVAIRPPGRDARRVTVQASIVKMRGRALQAAADHLAYIQRDGVTPDGRPGELYGPDGPAAPSRFEEPRDGERHQFRIILSPEDGGELDLTAFTRRLMKRIERDVGLELEWAAANHYDREHPHVHVVVRGVDLRGRPVRFDRSYISHSMRWRAQELATEELGPRSELEMQRARTREVTEERFTSLDRELRALAVGDRVALRPRPGRSVVDGTLAKRLEHLETLDLARAVSKSEWELRPGWERTLRDLAERRDIIKQMHRAVAGDPSFYQVVRRGEPLPDGAGGLADKPLAGRIAAKGLADEQRGSFFAVVETPGDVVYHLPLSGQGARRLRIGDFVSVGALREPAVLASDRLVVAAAAAHGGTYRLEDLESLTEDRRPAVAHRLRTLERMGLARQDTPGQWRVAPDLLEQLEKRHAQVPVRHRLLVKRQPLALDAQVHYRGPVWLDQVEAESLAPHGLGGEVARALRAREGVLEELGISRNAPDRLKKLFALEREQVAEQFGKRSGQRAIALGPHEFRGQAEDAVAPSGNRYVIISDGDRFAVVRSRDATQLRGKPLAVTRDAAGRPVVRETLARGLE